MMNEKQNKKISKFLSLVLRHKPETLQLKLDENGWAIVDELIDQLNKHGLCLNFAVLDYVVQTNSKKRFAFNNDKSKIRASQGHSLSIDLNYIAQKPPDKLYHGTSERFIASILKTGIDKRQRHHVHLSSEIATALQVGRRHGKALILEILSAKMQSKGHEFYLSENKVWLTDYVPIEFIKILKQTTL